MATPVWTTVATITSVNPPATTYTDATVPWADEAFIYRIEVNYKSGAAIFDSAKSSSIDKPSQLAAPTSVKVAESLSTSALVSWNYTLSAINVDEFEIQMTAKSSMGGTLGNPESTFRSYISTTSSYSQKIFYDTICTNNNADHVDFSVRVNPTDASINSSSAWIFAGSLICPTICFVGGNC